MAEVEPGRAVFAIEPAEWMYNPIGSVHGGVAATLLDSCMGCAVHTTLDAGVGYTTTDLQVRYIRAMRAGAGRVLAEGRVVHAGRRTATAEGRLFWRRTAACCSRTPAPAARSSAEAGLPEVPTGTSPGRTAAHGHGRGGRALSSASSPRRRPSSACSAARGSSGTIAPFGTRLNIGAVAAAAPVERRTDHHAVADDERRQGAPLDVLERGLDAHVLLGEGLAAGEGEAGLAAGEGVEQLGRFARARPRSCGRSSRRRRSPSAARPRRGSSPIRAATTSAVSRARSSGLHHSAANP